MWRETSWRLWHAQEKKKMERYWKPEPILFLPESIYNSNALYLYYHTSRYMNYWNYHRVNETFMIWCKRTPEFWAVHDMRFDAPSRSNEFSIAARQLCRLYLIMKKSRRLLRFRQGFYGLIPTNDAVVPLSADFWSSALKLFLREAEESYPLWFMESNVVVSL